ncbi:MAG: hypothetical protein U9O85_08080 [Euryarchaeota archaeon]|nr:hypothetical protein [Euryarchaeota archaeon]
MLLTENVSGSFIYPLVGKEEQEEKMDITKKVTGIFIAAILVMAVFAAFSASANENNFNANDYKGTGAPVSSSTTVAPLAVEWGQCGPIDLVIVLDDTGSMGGAINNIQAGVPNIIATANTASVETYEWAISPLKMTSRCTII